MTSVRGPNKIFLSNLWIRLNLFLRNRRHSNERDLGDMRDESFFQLVPTLRRQSNGRGDPERHIFRGRPCYFSRRDESNLISRRAVLVTPSKDATKRGGDVDRPGYFEPRLASTNTASSNAVRFLTRVFFRSRRQAALPLALDSRRRALTCQA